MNVTYANAAQIQTQITESKEGDFFIAGSADEVKPIKAVAGFYQPDQGKVLFGGA